MAARTTLILWLLGGFLLAPHVGHAQTVVTHNPQAQAHRNEGDKRTGTGDYSGALREYQAAYDLDKRRPTTTDDAATDLRKIGNTHLARSQYQEALKDYRQALPLFRSRHDRSSEASILANLGLAYSDLHQIPRAEALYRRALTLARQCQDARVQAIALNNLGTVYFAKKQYGRAVDCYRKAVPLYQQVHRPLGQVDALMNLGDACQALGKDKLARDYYGRTIALCAKSHDSAGQREAVRRLTNLLDRLGTQALSAGQYGTADIYKRRALLIAQQNDDPISEAVALENLGTLYAHREQPDLALRFYRQAISVFQKAGSALGEARVQENIAALAQNQGNFTEAAAAFQQAVALYHQGGDPAVEARDLNDLGDLKTNLAQYDQALTALQESLRLRQQSGDTDGQASALLSLGVTYDDLTQYEKAATYLQQALPLFQKARDADGEADSLNDLGNVFFSLNQYDQAIAYYQQALSLHQKVKDVPGQANALMNLGHVERMTSQSDRAIRDILRASALFQQVHQIDGQANALNNLGAVYHDSHQYENAVAAYQQALLLFRQSKDRYGEATDLNALMELWARRGSPRLAIFYGKQAVNVYQSIRQDIQTMDQETQKTYLNAKEPTYRELAELLIQQGRLPEAEQVLGLLKDQELTDFVQRDPSQMPPAQRRIPSDPAEQAQQDTYATLSESVTAIGAQVDTLRRKHPLTPADAKQLTQLQDQLQPAQAKFQTFLADLPKELPEATQDAPDPGQLLLNKSLQGPFQKTLYDLGPGTVALYTIVEPDRYRVVVVTSQTQIAREYPISSTDLREKVAAFRKALQLPDVDPRPYAHDLYQILVGPVEKDLQGAQATTVMWSLDDVLRYIPMAALYDGKQYLVERYRSTEFTGASLSGLDTAPPAQYTVLGLGVSEAHTGYPALPGVPQELNGIVKEGTGSPGVMDGTVLLDGQLTWEALKTDLNLGYPVVHIASHFDLGTDYAHSFLLLGDGPHSLDELSTQSQIFQSASLLTLSACDTGVGGTDGDGHEIESFGALAQEKGAQSIIASLWPVADASTPLLMDKFYKELSLGKISKGEALRQAQLALLHGTASASATGTRRAQIVPGKSNTSVVDAPPFMPDPKAPFAHPYYWAPFILIGNWK